MSGFIVSRTVGYCVGELRTVQHKCLVLVEELGDIVVVVVVVVAHIVAVVVVVVVPAVEVVGVVEVGEPAFEGESVERAALSGERVVVGLSEAELA